MNSKQIAVKYLAPKISNPSMIFKDINILKSVLPWAKDSAREFFATQTSKMFLLPHVDDVAPLVDEYLISRATRMYEKALKSENKLFTNLCSSQKTVAWIIDRWINIFVNLTTNPAYKEYIDITRIKIILSNEINIAPDNIEDILELEELQKLPKEEIIRAIKYICEDGYLNNSPEKEDIVELCIKYELSIKDVFGAGDLVKQNSVKKQTKSGYFQLAFVF